MTASLRIGVTIAALFVGACGSDARFPEYEFAGHSMGTTFSIKLVEPPDTQTLEVLRSQITAALEHVDGMASTYKDTSELSLFNSNQSTDWQAASVELCQVLEQTLQLSQQTGGAFDVTVGPLVNLWGFGPDGDVQQPPGDDGIQAVAARVGYEFLHTDCAVPAIQKSRADVYVDLSGYAKGYAVDQVAKVLDEGGQTNYLVEIGGEMRMRGHNAERLDWAVAIEAPDVSGRNAQSVLRLSNSGMATSGDYRNFFEYDGIRYSHTMDARSGRPVSHALAAVTVIDPSAAFADGMATALLVLGPEAGPALAEDLDIAAYFLVHGQAGVEELTSSTFDAMNLQ